MKKFVITLILNMILPLSVFTQVKHVFFDFNTYEDQINSMYPPENILKSDNGTAIAELGAEGFLLDNWKVILTNSSGQNPFSRINSYTKKITSQEKGTVLGIRIFFPEWPNSCEVHIKPVFPLYPFSREGKYININNGVVTNVGIVKNFSSWINGRGFPYSMGVRVRDLKNRLTEFTLGSLQFIGWRKLVHSNRFFSERTPQNVLPNLRIYPSDVPLLRFETFVIYRPGNVEGGNFVSYIGSSEIEYTSYLTYVPDDIDDEQNWMLIKSEQERIAGNINKNLYEEILQFEYAKQRLYTDYDTNNQNNQTQ
ncbi:MAG: flagellar filament outer layer protein FlaA [Brevinemataceae bacterium]